MFLIKKAKIDEGGRRHGAKIKLCVTLGKTPRQNAKMVKGVGKLPKVSWSFVYITVWKTYVVFECYRLCNGRQKAWKKKNNLQKTRWKNWQRHKK